MLTLLQIPTVTHSHISTHILTHPQILSHTPTHISMVTLPHTLKCSRTLTYPHTFSRTLTPSNSHSHKSHALTHSHMLAHTHTHTHTLTCALLTPAVSRPLPSAKATLRLCKCHQLCCLGPGRPGTLGSEGCCGLVPGPLAPHKLKDAQNPSALGLRRFRGRATLLKPEPLNPSTPRASRARQSWERPEEGPALGLG